MNTATASLRVATAASVFALAACLFGCAASTPAAEARPDVASNHVVAAMHRVLMHEAAGRTVSELLVRARLADVASVPPGPFVITRLHGH